VSASGDQGTLNLGSGVFPQEIFVAPGQRFVYATLFSGPKSEVHIYILDTTDWRLTEAPSSPLPGFSSVTGMVADPSASFCVSEYGTESSAGLLGGFGYRVFYGSGGLAICRA
jgi:hypothetical protein